MLRLFVVAAIITLSGCASEPRIIERPVVTEIEVVRYVPVPSDLLRIRPKQAIPEAITYGEALTLWAKDRASLGALNGQIEAIGTLTK